MRISRFHLSPAAASTGWGAASTETEMRAQARTRTGRQRTFIVRVRRLDAGGRVVTWVLHLSYIQTGN